ncbi:SdpI family protein [Mycolicibacterium sp. J2]|jgi:uncharacterized membrane protein|uniref:SdpI family protein n=1 Tax=Mycolicibacterium sp. J2 TaxID=2993511 RepID=UPI00224B4619|nr:SdpI family protein [Mycolicibacterium sp. J2]MCX2715652.1 SdpI family protein [Mycolicibacterium sp. J2]
MDAQRSMAAIVAGMFIVTFVVLVVVMAAVASRASTGALARNQWAGIRSPSTMRSDQAWVAAHRAATRLTPLYVLWAAVADAALVLAILRAWSIGAVIAIAVAAFAVFFVVAMCTAALASRAAKAVDNDTEGEASRSS